MHRPTNVDDELIEKMHVVRESLVIAFDQGELREVDAIDVMQVEFGGRRHFDGAFQHLALSTGQRCPPMELVIALVLFIDENRLTFLDRNVIVAEEVDDRGSVESAVETRGSWEL